MEASKYEQSYILYIEGINTYLWLKEADNYWTR